jgi:hypothetical protein
MHFAPSSCCFPTDDARGEPRLSPFRTAGPLQYGCAGPCSLLPVWGSLSGGLIGAVPPTAEDVRNSKQKNFETGYITVVPIQADYTAEHRSWVKFGSTVNTFQLED